MESLRRRDFVRGMSFLGVAAGVKAAAASYNPAAKFGVNVSEVEYRRTKAGRQLMARTSMSRQGRDRFQPFSIFTAARGTQKTARLKNRWIAL